MNKEMQKLRQRVAEGLTRAQTASSVTGCSYETRLMAKGVQAGSISMLEAVLDWIDEIVAEGQ